MTNIRLGNELRTGKPVDIPVDHTAVTGRTQQSAAYDPAAKPTTATITIDRRMYLPGTRSWRLSYQSYPAGRARFSFSTSSWLCSMPPSGIVSPIRSPIAVQLLATRSAASASFPAKMPRVRVMWACS